MIEPDDGPLTASDIKRIREAAEPLLPKGRVIRTRSLLDETTTNHFVINDESIERPQPQ